MAHNYNKILVVDLEATCWQEEAPPEGQSRDIIQVGFVILDTATGEISMPIDYLVKPERSEISDFCRDLTGITKSKVYRGGFDFKKVCDLLEHKWGSKGKLWAAWGNDALMFSRQCKEMNVDYPFGTDYINISAFYNACFGTKSTSLTKIMEKENIPFIGKAHTASADALSASKLLYRIIEKTRKN